MKIKPKSTQTLPKHNSKQYPIENPFGKLISTQNPSHRCHGGLGRKREIFLEMKETVLKERERERVCVCVSMWVGEIIKNE